MSETHDQQLRRGHHVGPWETGRQLRPREPMVRTHPVAVLRQAGSASPMRRALRGRGRQRCPIPDLLTYPLETGRIWARRCKGGTQTCPLFLSIRPGEPPSSRASRLHRVQPGSDPGSGELSGRKTWEIGAILGQERPTRTSRSAGGRSYLSPPLRVGTWTQPLEDGSPAWVGGSPSAPSGPPEGSPASHPSQRFVAKSRRPSTRDSASLLLEIPSVFLVVLP